MRWAGEVGEEPRSAPTYKDRSGSSRTILGAKRMAAWGRRGALSKRRTQSERCATGSRVRRRRSPIEPFLLCIIDYDNNRFTIEGPMTDAEGWIREVVAARRAGRGIVCQVVAGAPDEAATAWAHANGGTRWPSGSIVLPRMPLC